MTLFFMFISSLHEINEINISSLLEINVYLICTRACSGQSVYDLRKGEWDSTISWSCIILGSSQVLPMEDCGKLLPW